MTTRPLRYAGTCRECQSALPARSRAVYDADTRTVVCVDCASVQAPEATSPALSAARGDGAGSSAETVALRAAEAADRLRARTAAAERRAAAFAQGAVGERAVAEVLSALTGDGWFALHDRAMSRGGNLDHLLIGPGGVVVVDAKNWSGEVTVRDGVLRANGRRRDSELDKVRAQVAEVRSALAGSAAQTLPVTPVMALAATEHESFPATELDGVTVVGLAALRYTVLRRPAVAAQTVVERGLRRLTEALPPAGEPLPPEEVERRALFYATHRFLYLRPWIKGAHRRVYLADSDGVQLGWKDLASHALTVESEPDTAVAEAFLGAFTPHGLSLTKRQVPKLGTNLPIHWKIVSGGLISMAYVVGVRWRKGSADRLYGTYASRMDGVHDLGYVDLATGRRHPSGTEKVAKDLREPDVYLKHLHANLPTG